MNPAVLQFHSSCLKLFLSAWLGSDKEPGQKLSKGSSPPPFLGLHMPLSIPGSGCFPPSQTPWDPFAAWIWGAPEEDGDAVALFWSGFDQELAPQPDLGWELYHLMCLSHPTPPSWEPTAGKGHLKKVTEPLHTETLSSGVSVMHLLWWLCTPGLRI